MSEAAIPISASVGKQFTSTIGLKMLTRSSADATSKRDEAQALLQSTATEFYTSLNTEAASDRVSFTLIDAKSLPRSGLHFLRHSLAAIFRDHFSFCEWYQEPGCCRSMPCALTGFAQQAQESRALRLRLVKSHDLDLKDPMYELGPCVRRLVLVRQPLYVLTSWFALHQLRAHENELARHGIRLAKVCYLHEREVYTEAFRWLDAYFRSPSADQLEDWLRAKEQYFTGFLGKWVEPLMTTPCSFTSVVLYEDAKTYLQGLLAEYRSLLDSEAQEDADSSMAHIEADFKPRQDPFLTSAAKLSRYLQDNAAAFQTTASRLAGLPSFRWVEGKL